MDRAFSHARIDRIHAAEDRRIAAKLRRDGRVLQRKRWMERDGRSPRRSFQEWHQILTRLTPSEIANFLESDTPMARRLRQSSPFMGVLPEAERRAIAGAA